MVWGNNHVASAVHRIVDALVHRSSVDSFQNAPQLNAPSVLQTTHLLTHIQGCELPKHGAGHRVGTESSPRSVGWQSARSSHAVN